MFVALVRLFLLDLFQINPKTIIFLLFCYFNFTVFQLVCHCLFLGWCVRFFFLNLRLRFFFIKRQNDLDPVLGGKSHREP